MPGICRWEIEFRNLNRWRYLWLGWQHIKSVINWSERIRTWKLNRYKRKEKDKLKNCIWANQGLSNKAWVPNQSNAKWVEGLQSCTGCGKGWCRDKSVSYEQFLEQTLCLLIKAHYPVASKLDKAAVGRVSNKESEFTGQSRWAPAITLQVDFQWQAEDWGWLEYPERWYFAEHQSAD